MHRNCILIKDLDVALDMILESNLILNGVFTHFSSAYKDDISLLEQKNKFDQVRSEVQNDNRFSEKIRFQTMYKIILFITQ